MNYLTNSAVFHPPRPLVVYPLEDGLMDAICQSLWREHHVACSVLPHPSAKCLALYCHGNAENLHTCAWFAEQLREECHATVYCLEYPGYFCADGKPGGHSSERGLNDAAAALAAALAASGPLPLLIVGYSLGSAPAVHAAAEEALAGRGAMLALMAPLLGALRTQVSGGFLSALISPFDVMRTDRAAARARLARAIVVHGEADHVIPCWHGRKLAEALRAHTPQCTFWAMPSVTHDTVRPEGMPLIAREVRKWLDEMK